MVIRQLSEARTSTWFAGIPAWFKQSLSQRTWRENSNWWAMELRTSWHSDSTLSSSVTFKTKRHVRCNNGTRYPNQVSGLTCTHTEGVRGMSSLKHVYESVRRRIVNSEPDPNNLPFRVVGWPETPTHRSCKMAWSMIPNICITPTSLRQRQQLVAL